MRRTNISKNNRIVDPFDLDDDGNDISNNNYVKDDKKSASPEARDALQKALLDLESGSSATNRKQEGDLGDIVSNLLHLVITVLPIISVGLLIVFVTVISYEEFSKKTIVLKENISETVLGAGSSIQANVSNFISNREERIENIRDGKDNIKTIDRLPINHSVKSVERTPIIDKEIVSRIFNFPKHVLVTALVLYGIK